MCQGERREELVNLNLDQVVIGAADPTRGDRAPVTPAALRKARKVQLINVRGKNQTLRNLFLSADARAALADYPEMERSADAEGLDQPRALFLRAGSIQYAKKDDHVGSAVDEGDANGRLTVRSINKLVTKIGELHDAEQEGESNIGGLHPHMLRHTFGFRLAEETGKDKFELQRRLGHQSEAYIRVYTIPTEEIASGYVEKF
ncbi:site-specific integrase [Ktedonobacter racemifer]|uniref:Integrase family protein n=1 Tax=Ktedonobacter racemifer DSM 44963 TaxID=485913 RepID=D6TVG0_KTERA|nr:site-specific integrase [Ktedonobacter racemifer]EFH85363.1 integrase family protein [Ktedonobacter racemifer DSM 44963]